MTKFTPMTKSTPCVYNQLRFAPMCVTLRLRAERAEGRMIKKLMKETIAPGELPHEWLLKIMRGEPIYQKRFEDIIDPVTRKPAKQVVEIEIWPTVEQRMEAAKACAKFFSPTLSSSKVSTDGQSILAELQALVKGLPE